MIKKSFLFVLFIFVITSVLGGVSACHCGDGSINLEGEECDGSDFGSLTCLSLGFDSGELSCENCLIDNSTCFDFECGNNLLEGEEECDDGNLENQDGCSSECLIEDEKLIPTIGPENPSCKDSLEVCFEVINYSEILSSQISCEAGDTSIIETIGKFVGNSYCSTLSNITLEAIDELKVSCEIFVETENSFLSENISTTYNCSTCGDELVEREETCDDGSLNGILCQAGYEEFCSYCTNECLIEEIVGPYCGDGNIDLIYEECDDGNNLDNDTCSSECLIEEPVCGNSYLEENETCDDGNLNGVLCQAGYEEFCSYCTNECLIEEIRGPYCGDNICSSNENENSCRVDCREDDDDDDDDFDNYYEEVSEINNSCLGAACFQFNQLEEPSLKFSKEEVSGSKNNLLPILLVFAAFFLLSFLALFSYFKFK